MGTIISYSPSTSSFYNLPSTPLDFPSPSEIGMVYPWFLVKQKLFKLSPSHLKVNVSIDNI